MTTEERYWIAINGASCAMSAMPLENPVCRPTPQQLIGFPTFEEARAAQRLCLTAPISEVRAFMRSLVPHVLAGRVCVIEPEHPDPSTTGPTAWMDGEDPLRFLPTAGEA